MRRLGDGEFVDMYMEYSYGWQSLQEQYPEETKAWDILRTIFRRFGRVYQYNSQLRYQGVPSCVCSK